VRVGRCRYGLMCNENGFLFDDGVVVRLSEESFLCHTTSGGSDGVHAWMEEWLQTEWWDFKVYTANVTEQYAQIGVVGPKARMVLETLGGMDVSSEALPFMAYSEGKLAGIAARVMRISFSGELSYEIAVPAKHGLEFWEACLREDRKQLVGLSTENPEDVLPDGAHAVEGEKLANGMENMIGHVTSTYFSPTLNRSIAMALIKGGSKRMGETLSFPVSEDQTIKATVVDPVFLDKEGERQNV